MQGIYDTVEIGTFEWMEQGFDSLLRKDLLDALRQKFDAYEVEVWERPDLISGVTVKFKPNKLALEY